MSDGGIILGWVGGVGAGVDSEWRGCLEVGWMLVGEGWAYSGLREGWKLFLPWQSFNRLFAAVCPRLATRGQEASFRDLPFEAGVSPESGALEIGDLLLGPPSAILTRGSFGT